MNHFTLKQPVPSSIFEGYWADVWKRPDNTYLVFEVKEAAAQVEEVEGFGVFTDYVKARQVADALVALRREDMKLFMIRPDLLNTQQREGDEAVREILVKDSVQSISMEPAEQEAFSAFVAGFADRVTEWRPAQINGSPSLIRLQGLGVAAAVFLNAATLQEKIVMLLVAGEPETYKTDLDPVKDITSAMEVVQTYKISGMIAARLREAMVFADRKLHKRYGDKALPEADHFVSALEAEKAAAAAKLAATAPTQEELMIATGWNALGNDIQAHGSLFRKAPTVYEA